MGAWVLTFSPVETPPIRPVLTFTQLSLLVYHSQADYLRNKIYKLSKEIDRFAKQNPTKPPIPMDKLLAAEQRLEDIEAKIISIIIDREQRHIQPAEEEEDTSNMQNVLHGLDPENFL